VVADGIDRCSAISFVTRRLPALLLEHPRASAALGWRPDSDPSTRLIADLHGL
jgi:hypothetical protein